MWPASDSKLITRPTGLESEGLKLVSEGCDLRKVCFFLQEILKLSLCFYIYD